jgi:hypothetical protein
MAFMLAAAHAAPPQPGAFELESSQTGSQLRGSLTALVDRPFDDVQRALADRAGWCGVLILDPNVHRCQPQAAGIEVAFGDSQEPVAFSFQPFVRARDQLRVRLTADSGPFGTTDHVIALEAAPLGTGGTRIHLSSSQRFGIAARLATLAYFNTLGRGKVGFTVVGHDAAGQAMFVGDLRGGLERNLVRQYYAILAYLDSLSAPREVQPDRRVHTWLAYTQRHPLQLREDPGYFERKLPDVRRQHAAG